MIIIRRLFTIMCVGVILNIGACQSVHNEGEDSINILMPSDELWQHAVLSFDTVPKALRIRFTDSLLQALNTVKLSKNYPYRDYLIGYRFQLLRQEDSALFYYNSMRADPVSETAVLKDFALLSIQVADRSIAPIEISAKVIAAIERAEKLNSIYTYRLYELMAKVYYQNGNFRQSLNYMEKQHEQHPFKTYPMVELQYLNNTIMIFHQEDNIPMLEENVQQYKKIAQISNDTEALLKVPTMEMALEEGIENPNRIKASARKLQGKINNSIVKAGADLNNLAATYSYLNEYDSAIFYFKKAIAAFVEDDPKTDVKDEYRSLMRAYRAKGDYKNALTALDSSLRIHIRNTEAIQAEKIEELNTRYETEKKDNAIKSLKINNALNQKIIYQQRSIFAIIGLLCIGSVAFIYNISRRKLLAAKNEKLLLENKRLILEQKTRQMQLDPHFIYNSIANLQGLISGDKKEDANNYLVTFSRVMRNVLELNRHEFVSLEDEINSVENYIRLQQMRFENSFSYNIDEGDLNMNNIIIPPMLLQPFVENAIVHGFKSISYPGKLNIVLRQKEAQLYIQIIDNGIGLQTHADAEDKKSLSGIIIQERLDVLFNANERQAYFEVHPLREPMTGVEVNLYIPLLTV